jgi:hypothetical protein
MLKMSKANVKKNGGFPIQVMIEGEKKPRVIRDAGDMEQLAGTRFRVVNTTQRQVHQKAVDVDNRINFNSHMHVKVAGIIPIASVEPSPENPETHLFIKLQKYAKTPVIVQKTWWEKFCPKKMKENEQLYLVSHFNGMYSVITHTNLKNNFQPLGDKIEEAVSMLNAHGYVVTSGDVAAVDESRKRDEEVNVKDRNVTCIIGTDLLPAMVELTVGVGVSLRDIVQRAFQETGVSAEDWNDMEGQVRDAHIMKALEDMKREQAVVSDEPSASEHDDVKGIDKEMVEANQHLDTIIETLVIPDHYPDTLVDEIGGIVSMSEVVRIAWEKMNINVNDWNTMASQERTAMVDQTIDELKLTYPQPV